MPLATAERVLGPLRRSSCGEPKRRSSPFGSRADFWIEKLPLSVPGGLILLLRRDQTLRSVTREDLERVRNQAQREAAGAR